MAYRIKALRVARGWSQQQLAERAGTSQQQIWKWEGGHAEPAASAMIKLADAFDVTLDYLCGRTDGCGAGDDVGDRGRLLDIYERAGSRERRLLMEVADSIERNLLSA